MWKLTSEWNNRESRSKGKTKKLRANTKNKNNVQTWPAFDANLFLLPEKKTVQMYFSFNYFFWKSWLFYNYKQQMFFRNSHAKRVFLSSKLSSVVLNPNILGHFTFKTEQKTHTQVQTPGTSHCSFRWQTTHPWYPYPCCATYCCE